MERQFPPGKKLGLVLGHITTIQVDAMVNAGNSELQRGCEVLLVLSDQLAYDTHAESSLPFFPSR